MKKIIKYRPSVKQYKLSFLVTMTMVLSSFMALAKSFQEFTRSSAYTVVSRGGGTFLFKGLSHRYTVKPLSKTIHTAPISWLDKCGHSGSASRSFCRVGCSDVTEFNCISL